MKKLLITTATLLTLAGGAFALQPNETTTATEKTPIEAQVENHEVRIGDLETKTDNTQTQVNQNTADIAAVQDKTGIAPAPQVQAVQTPVAQPEATTQTNIVTPTPEPTPEPDPRTITRVEDTPGTPTDKNPNPSHTCRYWVVFDQDKYSHVEIRNPNDPCLAVGDLYPHSIPGLY